MSQIICRSYFIPTSKKKIRNNIWIKKMNPNLMIIKIINIIFMTTKNYFPQNRTIKHANALLLGTFAFPIKNIHH